MNVENVEESYCIVDSFCETGKIFGLKRANIFPVIYSIY